MARKPRKGYYLSGHFVAEGSALDQQITRERQGDAPSKTALKVQSDALQALGEQLLQLRADWLQAQALPARLLDALQALERIKDFGARRRQSQYVGKLMRQLEPAQIETLRAALQAQRQGAVAETALLHAAENWRAKLIASDAAITDWMAQFPQTQTQTLRALVRQARKNTPPPETSGAHSQGQAPRKGRAWRELFRLVRDTLAAANPAAAAADNPEPEQT
ncbi:MAG: DUF615 domain-containing protein [Burkholderiaceae bacterium]|nr:DUF615 domain-containing protein [Burkholderiaceae bacterium]